MIGWWVDQNVRVKYDGSYAKLQAAVEDFVRTVSTLSTAGRAPPAVAIFASFPYESVAATLVPERRSEPGYLQQAFIPVADHYRVPLWSYAEGVGEALTGHMPEPFWKEGEAGWKHPSWETHALFADVAAMALQTAEWQAGCVSPVSDQLGSVPRARDGSSDGPEAHDTQAVSTERPGLPDRVQETTLVCMQESSGTEGLLAALSVRDGQGGGEPASSLAAAGDTPDGASSAGWWFGEDVAGKFGWLMDTSRCTGGCKNEVHELRFELPR